MNVTTKFDTYFLKAWFILLVIGFTIQGLHAASTDTTTNQNENEIHNKHTLEVGKRLFHGLIKTGEHTVDCGSCHYTNQIDTLNWNPSALAIAKSTEDMDSAAFAGTLF